MRKIWKILLLIFGILLLVFLVYYLVKYIWKKVKETTHYKQGVNHTQPNSFPLNKYSLALNFIVWLACWILLLVGLKESFIGSSSIYVLFVTLSYRLASRGQKLIKEGKK